MVWLGEEETYVSGKIWSTDGISRRRSGFEGNIAENASRMHIVGEDSKASRSTVVAKGAERGDQKVEAKSGIIARIG